MDIDDWIRRKPVGRLAVILSLVAALAAWPFPAPAQARLVVDAVYPWRSTDHHVWRQQEPEDNTSVSLYRVRAGDTLLRIAHRNGLDVEVLAAMNYRSPRDPIYVGQYLMLPEEREEMYTVRLGDTLWSIARAHRVEVNRIIAANELDQPDRLRVGQVLAIPQESRAVAAVGRADQLAARGVEGLFIWPLMGIITSPYGLRKSGFHHGLDIAPFRSTLIKAAAAGRVVFSGWRNSAYGRAVIVDHGNGLTTLYAHNSTNLVQAGDYVKAGQAIARVGKTGRATGPHLHFEVYQGGKTMDPLLYLKR